MRRLQTFVMRTSPWPPFRWVYAAAYALALGWLVLRLRRVPQIRALDLRPPRRGHCFGSSDLDLRAETVALPATEFFRLADGLAHVLLPGGTWRRIFDLYLFPEADHALKRMVVAQSIARDRRWIRLVGAPAPALVPPPEQARDAPLGRAVYDYTASCEALFEAPLDLHHVRLVYGQVARIDGEHGAARAPAGDVSPALVERVRVAAARSVRGRVPSASFEELAGAHAVALAQTSALARMTLARGAAGAPRAITTVPPGEPPETLAAVVAGCRDALAELGAGADGAIRSVVLGAVPGSRYEYRLYVLIHDGLALDAHVALCRAIRLLFVAANPRIPYRLFRLRYPLLLTSSAWEASGRWYHALRPLEEHFFLERHGVVLCGDDPPVRPVPPDDDAIVRSAAVTVADLRNRIWGALHHRRPGQLADLIAGRIPTLWLILRRGQVATSPAEVVRACGAAAMPHAGVLADLHEGLAGCEPARLPAVDAALWQPALDVLSEWLDDLVEAALAGLAALKPPGTP